MSRLSRWSLLVGVVVNTEGTRDENSTRTRCCLYIHDCFAQHTSPTHIFELLDHLKLSIISDLETVQQWQWTTCGYHARPRPEHTYRTLLSTGGSYQGPCQRLLGALNTAILSHASRVYLQEPSGGVCGVANKTLGPKSGCGVPYRLGAMFQRRNNCTN